MRAFAMRGLALTAGLALAFTAGWMTGLYVGAPRRAPEAAAPRDQAVPAAPTSSGDVDKLRDENEQLREQLARIEEERKNLGRDYLQLAMKQSFESAGSKASSPEEIRASWEKGMARILAGHGGMFGNLEDTFALAVEIASRGEAGIRFLGSVASDLSKTDKERELALQIMARIRHRTAFDYLLNFRDEKLTELDYPYDLIRLQVASLPTDQIASGIPGILNQINTDLGGDNFSPERAEVLLYLADTHRNAQAQQLLSDSRMWQENVQGALEVAQSLHDQTAYTFLVNIEQHHVDPAARQRAAAILDAW